jgi:hypothetical protein
VRGCLARNWHIAQLGRHDGDVMSQCDERRNHFLDMDRRALLAKDGYSEIS